MTASAGTRSRIPARDVRCRGTALTATARAQLVCGHGGTLDVDVDDELAGGDADGALEDRRRRALELPCRRAREARCRRRDRRASVSARPRCRRALGVDARGCRDTAAERAKWKAGCRVGGIASPPTERRAQVARDGESGMGRRATGKRAGGEQTDRQAKGHGDGEVRRASVRFWLRGLRPPRTTARYVACAHRQDTPLSTLGVVTTLTPSRPRPRGLQFA